MLKNLFKSPPPAPTDDEVDFSVIVVAYDMHRELARTLRSLCRNYQQDVENLNYEVIVVDNGSPEPVSQDEVCRWGSEFKLLRINDASPSPADAINRGVAASSGRNLCLLIDGARLVTPGILHWADRAFAQQARSLVSVIGFHLGPDIQRLSTQRGYDQNIEDSLLDRIGWPQDAYRLFEIASLAGSSASGWSGPMAESNCLFLPRTLFDELDGFESSFDSPGGGMVNLDFYRRACAAESIELFYLMGEGCFHQIHGGVTTGGKQRDVSRFDSMQDEYRRIRGETYRTPPNQPILFGRSRPRATWLLGQGASYIIEDHALASIRNQHMEAVGLDYHW